MTWKIDFDLMEQARDRNWEEFLKEPIYRDMFEMQRQLGEELKPWMQKLCETKDAEKRAQIRDAMQPIKETRDEIIARLAEAFSFREPMGFIPSRRA